MGLPPGPQYKTILDKLRAGWIDEDIQNEQDEQYYLHKLMDMFNYDES